MPRFGRRGLSLASALLAAIALLAVLASPALAVPRAELRASLRPERLGAPTTVSIGFHLAAGPDGALPPLGSFGLRLPSGMGFAASELGLATCSPSRLLAVGVGGCPHESLMGFGSAQVQVPFGAAVVRETARVSIFMTKPVGEHTATLFYFDGRTPVIAPLVLRSEVITPEGSADSVLSTPIAPIPTTVDGPEVSMLALRASIGPRQLRYFKRVDHRRVAYRPEGLSLPAKCPPGGFRFRAAFSFRDGSRTSAETAVPCPPPRDARAGRHG